MTYTMKTGYAFEASAWNAPNDDWDTVVYTPKGGEKIAGVRPIDGTPCVVFRCPDGKYRAQTVVYCQGK